MQSLAPIITVPRRFWDREYAGCALPKAVTVTFEVAGQPVEDVSAHGYVSVAEDSELRLSGLWAVSQDRFPGHLVFGWSRGAEDNIRLQLQPPDSADEQHLGIDRKRQAPADLPEPQAKVQALGARLALEWESPREQVGPGAFMDWRQDGRDGARLAAEPPQRLVSPTLLPTARLGPRRGGAGGRMRGGSRATATGRGCAKLVRTTTRLYIGVGQVREWLGEVGARTELQVKVMLDNRMLFGVHQADLLYNKGAHYYWITSRTLKRTAMGKWFLGWSHTPADGLVLLLRSPSKDEIAAAIAEGFQGKEEDEDTEVSEQQQLQQQMQQQQMLQALSPPSPHPGRLQQTRSLTALAYADEEAMMLMQQQQGPTSELEDVTEGGQYHRGTPLTGAARLGPTGDDDDAVSGLSGDSELRRALGPSDPRLMVAIAAAELQRQGMYGSTTPGSNMARRLAPGQSAGPGPARVYSGGRDARDMQQQLLSARQQAGPGLSAIGQGPGGGQGQYREPPARTASEGLNAPTVTIAPAGPPRSSAAQPSRFTNFSEVPGGTAFANVPLPAEGLALEAPMPLSQQQQRGGAVAMPSQLGATTSIASNLSLAGATQLTGAVSMLQASGVAGPIAAPLRLPTNVSELLPPEYLPAAVSVRCTLDGSLQPDIFACEIHRSRQGHCYLYNLPPSVLEGRSQQDWMISEDGCLVLCLKTAPQALALVENKSVRSNPSNPQGGGLVGGPSVNADNPNSRGSLAGRGHASMEKPSLGRPQRKNSDADLAVAAVKSQAPEFVIGTAAAVSPKAPDPHEQLQQLHEAQAFEADVVAAGAGASELAVVVATLPVAERKSDGRRDRPAQLAVPRQAIESLYGLVELPHPVLVRYQINGEMEPQVYLAEVADAGAGELILRGAPTDVLTGRTLVGWRRTNALSHQLLVVCLETRPESTGQAKMAAALTPTRSGRDEEARRARGDQPPAQQQGTPAAVQQQPQGRPGEQTMHWATSSEAQMTSGRPHPGSAANPFGQPQLSLSAGAPAPSSSQPSHRASAQQQLVAPPPSGSAQRQRMPSGDSSVLPGPQQQLQTIPSGPLPGVGSSKLPTSASLNPTSSLLPAQASNLLFSSSVRPDGHGSAATGGGQGSRPASAGARGGTGGNAPGGVGGQRAPQLNLDSAGGGMLQTVASGTQTPMQAPVSRLPPIARTPPSAPMFSWSMEGGTAGQGAGAAAPSVFAQYGAGLALGQEPSSPKGHAELPLASKRPQQPPIAPVRGCGGSGQHGTAADAAPTPRRAAQTGDYSLPNVGSQARASQQQQSLHHVGRQHDDLDLEARRSPGSGSGATAGCGDVELAPSSRGRRHLGVGSETDAPGLPAGGSGGQSDTALTLRYLSSQGMHSGSSGGQQTETSVAYLQDALPHPSRIRHDRARAHSPSWRFEVQPPEVQPTPRLELPSGPRAGAGSNPHDLTPLQPSPTSLPATGRATRWGVAAAAGADSPTQGGTGCSEEGRAPTATRYAEEQYASGSARPRAAATPDDVDMEGVGDLPGGGTDPSPRVADGSDSRAAHGSGRSGEMAGGGSPDAALRHAYDAAAEPRDAEMEDSVPGEAPEVLLPVRSEAHGRTLLAAAAQQGADGAAMDEQTGPIGRGMDVGEGHETAQQRNPAHQTWQRRGDAGQASPEASRHVYEQRPAAAAGPESSRQALGVQGSGGAAPSEHNTQPVWFPRLDLTGTTISAMEQGAAEVAAPSTSKEERAGRARSEDGEAGDDDKHPPRRPGGVLRMLSAVVREPDEGDKQQRRS